MLVIKNLITKRFAGSVAITYEKQNEGPKVNHLNFVHKYQTYFLAG